MANVRIRLNAVTMDCPDPMALGRFYAELLGWVIAYSDDEYACLGAPGAAQCEYPGVTLQRNPDYARPVWPDEPGKQQQMAHLDFAVDDLDAAVRHAIACGATEAPEQFDDGWRVMLDPVGHPFCLVAMQPLMDSPTFGLR